MECGGDSPERHLRDDAAEWRERKGRRRIRGAEIRPGAEQKVESFSGERRRRQLEHAT